jgi:aspartate carbamoyltransferase catalytic subunit
MRNRGAPRARRDLLSVGDLGSDGVREVMRVADSFLEVSERPIPKVPVLRGKTVATLFFEPSTRTRLSFETAAKRLSADTMSFTASGSSVAKGESLRDTVETVQAMGVDAMVVRHSSAGVPWQVASWVGASVINAGDGWHEHPTQALVDCFTIRQALARDADERPFDGLRVLIVGDVRHSRVARSDVAAFSALGAEIALVAPPTLLPPSLEGWPVSVSHDLDAELASADVVYLLRLQTERGSGSFLPSVREYVSGYGLTAERARLLAKSAIVMHPGPMNRGVEIAAEVADLPAAAVTRQVANGIAVRMAVLFLLLGSGRSLPGPRRRDSGERVPGEPLSGDAAGEGPVTAPSGGGARIG